MLLGSFIPYGVAAVIMSPIALLCSAGIGVSPIPILIGVAMAASLASIITESFFK